MLAVVATASEPFAFYDSAMAAFDTNLAADPEQSPDATVDRRIAELLEEAA